MTCASKECTISLGHSNGSGRELEEMFTLKDESRKFSLDEMVVYESFTCTHNVAGGLNGPAISLNEA